jgi:hypothetical protein
MIKLKYMGFFFALLLVATTGFSACSLDSNFDSGQVTYMLRDDSTASVVMDFELAYSKECLVSEFVDVDSTGQDDSSRYMDIVSDEVPCPEKFQELVLKSFPEFSNGINCYGRFDTAKNYLRMSIYASTGKLSSASDKNYFVSLLQNDLTAKLGKNSSLTIIFPQNSNIVSFSPKKTNFITPSIINWAPFPSERIEINYSPFDFQKETFDRILPILAIVSILFVFVTAVSIYFMRSLVIVAEKEDYSQSLSTIKDKIKMLESAYLKRQIDETTYRRLNEQYQLQLNDINSQLAKAAQARKNEVINKLNKDTQNSNMQSNNSVQEQKP